MKIAHFNMITYFNLSFGGGIEEGGVDIFVFLYLFFITIELILNMQFVQQFL